MLLDACWTGRLHAVGMLVTLILRLLPERLAEGELVGEVEHVYSGEKVLVRDLGELAGFAQESAAREREARPSTSA